MRNLQLEKGVRSSDVVADKRCRGAIDIVDLS